jgi:transmembrane sensor
VNEQPTEQLLPSYFQGTLSCKEKEKVENWKEISEENRQIFNDSLKAWQGIEHLQRMKKYNAGNALQKVHAKILNTAKNKFINIFQKVAAVLILPLFITTVYFATHRPHQMKTNTGWQTIKSPAGLRSEFVLPDGTKVFLNSKTSLGYPIAFNGHTRNVNLNGEAYFEVTKNIKSPFIVNTGKIQIEVTGTEFKASNYADENLTEVVLVSGSVNLFQGKYYGAKENLVKMNPGERASFKPEEDKIYIDKVNVDKYISWKDGVLMFREDSMPEVVRRLNRWFNADIKLTGKELNDYVYTATFEDESLNQILELLKMSAPIDYTIKPRERKMDKTFSKREIEIIQK